MKFWVYILECENNRYYTGYTNHLIKRYHCHVSGKASKFTRSFKPIRVAQCWSVAEKSHAMKMERYIKSLTRLEKEKIIDDPFLMIERWPLPEMQDKRLL